MSHGCRNWTGNQVPLSYIPALVLIMPLLSTGPNHFLTIIWQVQFPVWVRLPLGQTISWQLSDELSSLFGSASLPLLHFHLFSTFTPAIGRHGLLFCTLCWSINHIGNACAQQGRRPCLVCFFSSFFSLQF